MECSISTLTEAVRIALDENDVVIPLIATDNNTLTLDQIIRQKIIDAVRVVSEQAPFYMMPDASKITDAIHWMDNHSGYVLLPEDFLRLVSFRMSDWERSVTDPIDETDTLYSAQKSTIIGVRGNPCKPICAITGPIPPENLMRLEFYSCDNQSATVEVARCVKLPKIENEEILICERLFQPIVYHAAGLVAATVKNDNADVLFNLSKSYYAQ